MKIHLSGRSWVKHARLLTHPSPFFARSWAARPARRRWPIHHRTARRGPTEPAVLARRLPRVARMAEGLPVRRIPEQGHVALVRNDVIDFCRELDLAAPLTFHAERMCLQPPCGRLPPSVAVATLRRCAAIPIPLLPPVGLDTLMLLAVRALPDQLRAAWLTTRTGRGYGHVRWTLERLIS